MREYVPRESQESKRPGVNGRAVRTFSGRRDWIRTYSKRYSRALKGIKAMLLMPYSTHEHPYSSQNSSHTKAGRTISQ